MMYSRHFFSLAMILLLAVLVLSCVHIGLRPGILGNETAYGITQAVTFHSAVAHDVSQPLVSMAMVRNWGRTVQENSESEPLRNKADTACFSFPQVSEAYPLSPVSVEQTSHGTKAPPKLS